MDKLLVTERGKLCIQFYADALVRHVNDTD